MRIPVFVSSPTSLAEEQEKTRKIVLDLLHSHGLESRALGRTDYPVHAPLREVLSIARHCAGALILGFTQTQADHGVRRVAEENSESSGVAEFIPTPWNHLESGIAYALGLPLLVIKERGIRGGIFDHGTMEGYILPMPPPQDQQAITNLGESIRKWQGMVQNHYYRASS